MKKILLVISITIVLLSGCSSSTLVIKERFAKVIDKGSKKFKVYSYDFSTFPIYFLLYGPQWVYSFVSPSQKEEIETKWYFKIRLLYNGEQKIIEVDEKEYNSTKFDKIIIVTESGYI